MGGLKGVLALNHTLKNQIRYPKSMEKYATSDDDRHRTLEIIKCASSGNKGYLNREFISVLHGLGVPTEVTTQSNDYSSFPLFLLLRGTGVIRSTNIFHSCINVTQSPHHHQHHHPQQQRQQTIKQYFISVQQEYINQLLDISTSKNTARAFMECNTGESVRNTYYMISCRF